MNRALRLPVVLVGLLAAALLSPAPALAVAPALTVVPVAGPPTTAITLTGTGFGASEAVDVYAETTPVRLAVADATGKVTVPTTVPASAQPGAYWFTLVGRHSGTAAQVTFTVRTDSPMAGFASTQSSYNRYENTITATTAPSLQARWSAPIDVATQVVSSGGRVFVSESTTGHVLAYDAKTGVQRWRVAAPAPAVYLQLSPAVVGGSVVVERNDGALVGLNPANGATKWVTTVTTGDAAPVAPPVGTGSTVVESLSSGVVRALNATTGAVQWSTSVSGTPSGTPAISAAADLVVVVVSATLVTLDLATGRQIVSHGYTDQPTAPAIAGGVIAIGLGDDLCTLDLSSETTDVCVATATSVSAISIANNRIFAVLSNGTLQAFDLTHGSTLWTAPLSVFTRAPFVAGGLVWCAGALAKFTAFSVDTGQPVASVGGYAVSAPTVADGVLYAASSSSPYTLNAFSLPDGTTDNIRPDVAVLARRAG